MSYLNKSITKLILTEMQSFEKDLCNVFQNYGLNLRDNLGRRNALVSTSQERATANALRTVYQNVIEDGAPGKPDIYIADIGTELECKLTSGSRTKSTARSYSLQTDWETICKKKSLDYVYILANDNFDAFCVLFFEGLTPEDYYPPAAGSRGKSRMKKKNAMKKCEALYGSFTTLNKKYVDIYTDRIKTLESKCIDDITDIIDRSLDMKINEVASSIEQIEDMYESKITKLENKIKKWEEADPKFTYQLEGTKE